MGEMMLEDIENENIEYDDDVSIGVELVFIFVGLILGFSVTGFIIYLLYKLFGT